MADRRTSVRGRVLAVVERPLASLKPRTNNPRTHTKKQIRQIADSLKQFGWTNPVLIDDEDGIIAGHGRVEAARSLGMETVPTIRLSNMSEAEKRAYVIADNRLAELAGWDEELLKIEFQYLIEDEERDFDIEFTGFEMGDIDRIFGFAIEDEPETVELPDETKPAVSRPGDVWTIGGHAIACGDCRDAEVYLALLGNEKAAMVFTDPPYNVPVSGHVSGLGKVKHREFAMASGEMTKEQFTAFLHDVFEKLVEHSADGSIHFVCMDWRHMGEVLQAAEGNYTELKNLCVWAKTNAGMGSFYRSQHELIFAYKSGRAAHINNFGLGEKGRHRSNLWTYAGANTFRAGRMDDLEAHPTVKPTQMVADAILDCSRRSDLVLDVFSGSGATLAAAEETGRRGRAIEIDPLYVDLCVKRLEKLTGENALNQDFETFAEAKEKRIAAEELA